MVRRGSHPAVVWLRLPCPEINDKFEAHKGGSLQARPPIRALAAEAIECESGFRYTDYCILYQLVVGAEGSHGLRFGL